MNPATPVRIQIELEYGFNDRGLLVPFRGSTERARFIIYRYAGGCARYFRHDVPTSIKEEVEGLPSEEAVSNPLTVRRILGDRGDTFVGRAYVFPGTPAADDFPDVVRKGDRFTIDNGGEPVGGILNRCVNSQAVYPLSEQHGLKARERRYTAHEEGKHWE